MQTRIHLKTATDKNQSVLYLAGKKSDWKSIGLDKKEIDYLFDLDDETLGSLNIFSKKVARGIEKVIPCLRVGVCVIGLEVPHAHVHLIPLNGMGDINFANPKLKLSKEELTSIAEKINSLVDGL